MKDLYIVIFTNYCYEEIFAYSRKEAIISAQTKQLKKSNSSNIAFVKDKEGNIIYR